MNMYPLSFKEYLLSEGQDILVELIDNKDYKTIKQVKNKFENYFKTYCFIGGMPEVVTVFHQTHDMNKVVRKQRDIINE